MGIFDSGILVREKSIEEKGIVNRYQLASFSDRKTAYDRMKNVWSTHAKDGIKIESESEDGSEVTNPYE